MIKEIPAVFGSVFAPEMPVAKFMNGAWQETQWQPSDKLELHPAAHCLHYGSEIFEGMKAFRHDNNSVHIFQLDAGVERMRKSAAALYLPVPDAAQLKNMIIDLVRRQAHFVPDRRGAAYIRPALIGTESIVGAAGHPSHDALLYVLLSPVGDYFKQGSQLRIVVETEHIRCAPHMGSIKTGGNYAAALPWTMIAEEKYQANQVLFCPKGDVQETGASNFILIDGKTLITKPLTSEFLHGITRRSILQAARDNGYTVEERNFTVDEIKQRVANGAEAVLTGTAAVLSPVTHFIIDGKELLVKSQSEALKLRKFITDIQYGDAKDTHGWLTKVCDNAE
ncbi:MAG: branched-chain-amino-acid transaminase [Neisseriaceae bacterium]|nr:branched-chain-amino-acid transaminase [Neisseriaceae bacterium]MBR5675300.1 branched-chain-amino-acid transaminase [Neisseriaceae bacterium]